jgi:hypothetical protein
MVFLSPDFAKLRFRKTLRQKEGFFALNGPLYKLFFAVEENRSVAQIATELGLPLTDVRLGLERLCAQGMIAPLADQGPCLSNATMGLIQHHFNLAMEGQAHAGAEMLHVVRQLSEDGYHIGLSQARIFLNRLCDRIPGAEARQHFRTCVGTLIWDHKSPPSGPKQAAPANAAPISRGRTHEIIKAIIRARSRGNPGHMAQLKDAFRRYGIDPDHYGEKTRDDPKMVARLERMAHKTGIVLPDAEGRRITAELRRLLDAIIKGRHGDSPDLARHLHNQLRLKGIHPGTHGGDRPVTAGLLNQIQHLAEELGIDTTRLPRESTAPKTRGRIRQILDRILQQTSPGGSRRVMALRTKLLLRGIDPEAFTPQTPDDPELLQQVEAIADRLRIHP